MSINKRSKKVPAAARKQKFKAEYTTKWPFIVLSPKDEFLAECAYCQRISACPMGSRGGRSDYEQHVKSQTHERNTAAVR